MRPRPAHGLSKQALNVLITQDTVSSSRKGRPHSALTAVAQQGERVHPCDELLRKWPTPPRPPGIAQKICQKKNKFGTKVSPVLQSNGKLVCSVEMYHRVDSHTHTWPETEGWPPSRSQRSSPPLGLYCQPSRPSRVRAQTVQDRFLVFHGCQRGHPISLLSIKGTTGCPSMAHPLRARGQGFPGISSGHPSVSLL